MDEKLSREQLTMIEEIARSYIKYKRISLKMVSTPELVNCAVLRVLTHIDNFEPGRGVKLKTFLYYHIQGAILDHLRFLGNKHFSSRYFIKVVFLDMDGLPDHNSGTMISLAEERWVLEDLLRLIGNLKDERETQILIMYYFDGKKLEEIAQLLGLTKSWVFKLKRKAESDLRQMLVV